MSKSHQKSHLDSCSHSWINSNVINVYLGTKLGVSLDVNFPQPFIPLQLVRVPY